MGNDIEAVQHALCQRILVQRTWHRKLRLFEVFPV
jgi:hypothetical protein